MIIFPGLEGIIAASGKPITGSIPLDIQLSADGGASWTDFSIIEYYYDYGSGASGNYLIQALGTGTETLNVSSNNPQFFPQFSNFSNSYSINGGENVALTVNFYHTGNPSDYGTITVTSSGGDSISFDVYVTFIGEG